jgi:hypothetical protein
MVGKRVLGPMAVALALCCGTAADSSPQATPRSAASPHTAVLVELFTSEGCSSCPPADDLLADLIRTQPVANVTIIGFGEHVDYWDNLGWRDVFSAPAFTLRQSDYERQLFHTGSIYTPQAVIDGRFQVVGSDSAALRRAVANAAKSPKASINLTVSAAADLVAQIDVSVPSELSSAHELDVMAAVVERNLATKVQRGENGGHLLKHGAVARTLVSAGAMKPSERTFSRRMTFHVDSGWKRSDLQVVAFVQDHTTRVVAGAAVESPKSNMSGN